MSHIKHFDKWGHFTADGYGLIGHDSADVMKWAAAHPDFDGCIWFDYGTGEDDTEVTELFYPEPDEVSIAPGFDGQRYISIGNSRGSRGVLATDEIVSATAQDIVEGRGPETILRELGRVA